jgi:hypothetical protein
VPFEDRGRLTAEYLAAACFCGPPPTWPAPRRRLAWAAWRAVSVSLLRNSFSRQAGSRDGFDSN